MGFVLNFTLYGFESDKDRRGKTGPVVLKHKNIFEDLAGGLWTGGFWRKITTSRLGYERSEEIRTSLRNFDIEVEKLAV